jgi:PKD repeat protein
MKPHLTITLVLSLFYLSLTAQVKFKVKLLTDNKTFQVLMRSDVTYNPPMNTVSGAQVTLRVPAGGFTIGNLTSLKGTWSNNANVKSPPENPAYDYIVFGLQNPTSAIPFQKDVEVAVFEFKNNGTCTGAMELINTTNDPFMPPNSQNVNIGNAISIVGAGFGNAYTGNYSAISADCKPTSNCGIEVFDVILKSPSACGVADGRIEIVATTDQPLQLQYTINGGINWQNSPIFPGLAAGDLFDLRVRDEIPICIVEIGKFELDGPLAAVITGIDTDDPDCGASNGSITIHGNSETGGMLEFSIDNKATWQSSNTFTGLPAGNYPAWVKDITKNCENFITTIVLNDCPPGPACLVSYELAYMGSGRYQVQMTPDTTYTFPDNITSSMQVTVKVPTGGFVASNLTSQLTNVGWSISSTYVAPPEDPAHDYITFGMTSPGTQDIPYSKGVTTPLFTFENTGDCVGGTVSLMPDDDPFSQPNSQNAAVGQQLTVFGYGGADAPICIGGANSEPCEPVDPPAPSCLITYELEKLPNGLFRISFTPDTTWAFPANITSSAQYTVKVPTGGFVASNVTSLLTDVTFEIASTYVAPVEDPAHDYISFILGSPGTQGIPYQKGVKTPLFTFENSGSCVGSNVALMNNDTDPFFPPNSQNAAVGQQLTVFGYGGADAPICVVSHPADDCGGCAGLAAAFTANDVCEKDTVNFTDQTTSTETIVSWNWDFGDGSSPSNAQHPSHSYSSSGNFEVSLTVTTEGGCVATVTDSVTVFSSPGAAPLDFFSLCSGDGVTLQSPADVTAVWSPATGLDNPNSTSPFASPDSTTVYTATFTNAGGCTSQDQVTVVVDSKPLISTVTLTPGCGASGGTIEISAASASGCVEYSIDNGASFQASNTFTGLADGSYIVLVRNCNDACPVAWNGNPGSLTTPAAPTLGSVSTVSPTSCGTNDGSITVNASGGIAPLQYRLDGGAYQTSNVFQNLAGGTYTVEVANADLSCSMSAQATLNEPTPPTVVTPIDDFSLCAGNSATVSIQISENIQTFDMQGNGTFSGISISGKNLNFNVQPKPGTSNYSVVLTGVSGCTVTENFTLTELPNPTAAFSISTPSCTNGNVTLNFTGSASPTATYTWALDGGTVVFSGNTTRVVSWNIPGTKNVSLTVDDQGCQSTVSNAVDITNFDPIASLDVTDIAGCGGSNGSISLAISGSGSYSFAWSGPNGFTANTQNLSGLATGTYTVTITETGSLCSATASQQLSAPPALNIVGVVPNPASDCTGNATDGSLNVQVSGGTASYQYNLYKTDNLAAPIQSLNLSQTSASFTGLAAGAYQVEVVDVNGCNDVSIATVTSSGSPLSVSASNLQNAGCGASNGSFTVSATGTSPFTYVLYKNAVQADTGSFSGPTLNLTNLTPGNYTLIIVDGSGCVAPVVAVIETTPANFGVTANVVDPSCGSADGSITLANLPAGATFSWTGTNGSPLPPASSLADLPIGVYTVTVTNGSGCSESYTYTLQPTDGSQVAVSNVVNATCSNGGDGGVTFSVDGANAFSYQILNSMNSGFGDPNTPVTVSGLGAGAYVISIED